MEDSRVLRARRGGGGIQNGPEKGSVPGREPRAIRGGRPEPIGDARPAGPAQGLSGELRVARGGSRVSRTRHTDPYQNPTVRNRVPVSPAIHQHGELTFN